MEESAKTQIVRRERPAISILQRVAILIDANNIERGIQDKIGEDKMLNYLNFIPKVLGVRGLVKFAYFIEGAGQGISPKLMDLFAENYYGDVIACFKSADVPIAMYACMLMDSIDTFIIFSGDSDYIDCVDVLKAHGKRVEIVGVEGTISKRLEGMVHNCTYITKQDCWQQDAKYKKPAKKPAPVVQAVVTPAQEVIKEAIETITLTTATIILTEQNEAESKSKTKAEDETGQAPH